MALSGRCDGLEETASFFSSFSRGVPLPASDYDGTPAPFRKGGSVLSGRRVEEVAALLDISLEVWGRHGWERRGPERRVEAAFVPAGLSEAGAAVERAFKERRDSAR